jgi:aspartate-semialdehyde dehydrogenase
MNSYKVKIGILGATGTIGTEIIKIIEESVKNSAIICDLFLFSSTKGNEVEFLNSKLITDNIENFINSNDRLDILFSCASSEISAKYILPIKQIPNKVGIVIDKTEFFRNKVPLIIPEINSELIPHKNQLTYDSLPHVISSPNCVAIPIAVLLNPIKKYVKRIVISTYQSASGAGAKGIEKLESEIRKIISEVENFKNQFDKYVMNNNNMERYFAFNVIPKIGEIYSENHQNDQNNENNQNDEILHNQNFATNEENKVIYEVQKTLQTEIPISITCVRVPSFIGHAMSVNVELNNKFKEDMMKEFKSETDLNFIQKNFIQKIYEMLKLQNGLDIRENYHTEFETPIESITNEKISIGRLRPDNTLELGFSAWISSNNLRKGAALNAVQIALEYLKDADLKKD